ncbi:MAG: type II secretion system GspH family protein [Azoarcus sp.]|jgi:MSHA pilin protein MshC|nr:type II secretion system GspH family protein [Azoarcus sp.]
MGANERTRRCAGVTLIELVVVIVLLGILSAVVVPKMTDTSSFDKVVFRDALAATLRYAQKTAVSHRRLTCVQIETRRASIAMAAAHGSTACTTALPGPDGKPDIRAKDAATSVAPARTIYFQPNGDITEDPAGATPWNAALTVTGANSIQIAGATGYVQ